MSVLSDDPLTAVGVTFSLQGTVQQGVMKLACAVHDSRSDCDKTEFQDRLSQAIQTETVGCPSPEVAGEIPGLWWAVT